MSSLQLFSYGGQEVRTHLVSDEPWFVIADVCKVLELSNPTMAAQTLDADDLSTTEVMDSMGRKQTARTTNEGGVYQLVFQSRKPNARDFRRWVTKDVLPQIRKTGSYAAPVRELTFEEKMAEVMGTLNQRIEAQHAQLAIAAPKAEAFDVFLSASGDYDVRDAAQLLQRDHGINTGQRRLFAWLRDNHWIGKDNRPYQHRIDQDLLRIKAGTFLFKRTNGQEQLAAPQVRITPKGLERLRAELTTEGVTP